MPMDWYQMVPSVIDSIRDARPASVLEVAVGLGKFGVAIRNTLDNPFVRQESESRELRLDGFELLDDWRTPLHEYIYSDVYYGDVFEALPRLPSYDVVFLGDVLNYFDKQRGRELIREFLKKTRKALIFYSPKMIRNGTERFQSGVFEYTNRWWELDLAEYDATSFVVDTENGSYNVFHVYPSVREQTGFRKGKTVTTTAARRALKIAYVLPHKNLTGGVKTLLQQLEQLQKFGHEVTVVYEGHEGEQVLPPWSTFTPDNAVVVRDDRELTGRLRNCDVVMAGWVTQLPKLAEIGVPVLYWEKGHEWLFGDMPNRSVATKIRQYLAQCYAVPCEIVSVSSVVADLLKVRYGRETSVVPDGIDLMKHFPEANKPVRELKTVLLVGHPGLRFKGFDVALESLKKVWQSGLRFNVRWVCQVQPDLRDVPFPVEPIVSPPQDELPKLYREADIHLFTSWYEGFGMPPLEAMASGVAVVATDFGGGAEYLVPGENALVADPGDFDSLAAGVAYLLEDDEARAYLSREGRKTAEKFDLVSIAELLEQHLLRVAQN